MLFSGSSTGLLRRITSQNPTDISIALFRQFFDDEIISLMVSETNKCAEQFLASHQLRRSARMRQWTDVTKNEIEKILGFIPCHRIDTTSKDGRLLEKR